MIRSRICSAGHRHDPGADLLEGQLEDVVLGHAGPGDDPDDRAERPLVELERQGDPVGLEDDAGLVDLGGELVGEVGDQVLGEPGVDLLVGEDGLPGRLVADVVAELQALRHEPLGLGLALLAWRAGPSPGRSRAGGSARPRPRPGRPARQRRPRPRPIRRHRLLGLRIERPAFRFRRGSGEGSIRSETSASGGASAEPGARRRGEEPSRRGEYAGNCRVKPKSRQAGPARRGTRPVEAAGARHERTGPLIVLVRRPHCRHTVEPERSPDASCLLASVCVAILLYWVVAASA